MQLKDLDKPMKTPPSLVTLSYIFENVVKILTGRKFDISFLLEVPLSSGEPLQF